MKKAVILCSGGFDSVVLTHYVKNELNYEHGYCLFFNYKQKSYLPEKKWAQEHCKRVGYEFVEVEIPKFTWTNGGFYDDYYEDSQHQYLESRNKVFLAFATSLAEAKKCDSIFIGAIGGGEENYNDCTTKYFNIETKAIQESTGLPISISAPFCNTLKADLVGFARKFNILPNEWSSCDYVINGEIPCGECKDCESSCDVSELLLWTYTNNQVTFDINNSPVDDYVFADDVYDMVLDSYKLQDNPPINKVVFKCSPQSFDEVVRFKKLADKIPNIIQVIAIIDTLDLDWVGKHLDDLILLDEIHLPLSLKLKDTRFELSLLNSSCIVKYFETFSKYGDAIKHIELAEQYSVEDLILYVDSKKDTDKVEEIVLHINEESLKHKIRVQVVIPKNKVKEISSVKLKGLICDTLLYNYPFPVAFEKTAENIWSSYLGLSIMSYKSV